MKCWWGLFWYEIIMPSINQTYFIFNGADIVKMFVDSTNILKPTFLTSIDEQVATIYTTFVYMSILFINNNSQTKAVY